MHDRQSALNKWLRQTLGNVEFSLVPLAGDASFRRYYRLQYHEGNRIVMDAPPETESIHSFIRIARLLRAQGVRIPHLYAQDETLGFILLEDFGDQLLLKELSEATADKWYKSAIDILVTMQTSVQHSLPCFDRAFIMGELHLLRQWFLQDYLKMNLDAGEEVLLQQTFAWLADEINSQPKVFVHRDYHSRNIMVVNDGPMSELGILDFQDAMLGPFTYDLVSLLKDCYIQWPRNRLLEWLTFFYEQSSVAKQWTLPLFIRAFDLCGLQRHLKVLGVFSRLYLRDNKPDYLQDLPLILNYVRACLESCEELRPFYHFMQERIRLP